MLFFVSLLPFTTKFMATCFESDSTPAVMIYGLDILVATLTMKGIIRSAAKTPDILVDESAESELNALLRRRQFAVVIIVCTLVFAFFLPKIAVAGYIAVTILFFLIPAISTARARWKHTNRVEGERGKKSS
ncbi:MAG: hypothetical protein LUQ22_01310 [Methanotrichaceae archaeon]|nr:hypothetical protein [Methanotrichaceae archaeon]